MSEQPDLDQLLYDAENGWMLSVDGRVALAAEVRRLRAADATLTEGNRVACERFEVAKRRAIELRAENERLTIESERRRSAGESLAEQGFAALDRAEAAEAEVATLTDTLRRRTESHGRLVQARLACPTCSRLPLEETPA